MSAETVDQLCKRVGSTRLIAKALGVDSRAVSSWRKRNRITPALEDRVLEALNEAARLAPVASEDDVFTVLESYRIEAHRAPRTGKPVHPSRRKRTAERMVKVDRDYVAEFGR